MKMDDNSVFFVQGIDRIEQVRLFFRFKTQSVRVVIDIFVLSPPDAKDILAPVDRDLNEPVFYCTVYKNV